MTVSAGSVTVRVNSPDRIAWAVEVSRRRAFTVVKLKKLGCGPGTGLGAVTVTVGSGVGGAGRGRGSTGMSRVARPILRWSGRNRAVWLVDYPLNHGSIGIRDRHW